MSRMTIGRLVLAGAGATVGLVAGWHLSWWLTGVAMLLGAAVLVTPLELAAANGRREAGPDQWIDREGDLWEEREDGQLELVYSRHGDYWIGTSVVLPRGYVDADWGPLTLKARR